MSFLDTNILLRFVLQDQPDHAARASRLFERIADGQVAACISGTVIFECVYVLDKQFGVPKQEIAEGLSRIVRFPRLVVANRNSLLTALAFWADHGGLSFADCYHLALTQEMGLEYIYSFDQKMDRYAGVERIEP